jgi:hypothetical protein
MRASIMLSSPAANGHSKSNNFSPENVDPSAGKTMWIS